MIVFKFGILIPYLNTIDFIPVNVLFVENPPKNKVIVLRR